MTSSDQLTTSPYIYNGIVPFLPEVTEGSQLLIYNNNNNNIYNNNNNLTPIWGGIILVRRHSDEVSPLTKSPISSVTVLNISWQGNAQRPYVTFEYLLSDQRN